jgi:hypothetical protein
MVNYYELYTDETYINIKAQSQEYMVLGGLICTDKGRERLLVKLEQVRKQHNKGGEMKWNKISNSKLDFEAYKDWVNVFFEDRFARYVLFSINKSDETWVNYYRQKRQKESREATNVAYQEVLSAAYHQVLLVSFGKLHDTKRWIVYPDKGLFRDAILEMTKKHFNRTYKFPKSSNNIRFMEFRDSDKYDLLQLTDVLLGAFSHDYLDASASVRGTKYDILEHCKGAIQQRGFTDKKLLKLVSKNWVPEDQHDYALNFKMARSARWTQSY